MFIPFSPAVMYLNFLRHSAKINVHVPELCLEIGIAGDMVPRSLYDRDQGADSSIITGIVQVQACHCHTEHHRHDRVDK